MRRPGFTVIELIVTIIVITIITTLSLALMRTSEVAQRDDERKASAEMIARGLEAYFRSGDPERAVSQGGYPSIAHFNNARNGNYINSWLTGVDGGSLEFSWSDSLNMTTYGNTFRNGDLGAIRSLTENGDKIVYEPLMVRTTSASTDNDQWTACMSTTNDCRSFVLYYLRESDDQLVSIRSQN